MPEIVSTSQQLIDAINNGAQDIQISSHIDFSAGAGDSLPPLLTVSQSRRRIYVRCGFAAVASCSVLRMVFAALSACGCLPRTDARVRAQGDCSANPSGSLAANVSAAAPGLQRAPGACIIYLRSSFMATSSDLLWLDKLILVHGPPLTRRKASDILVVTTGSLFMTDSQVVGWHGPDGEVQPLVRAIAVDSGATKAFFQSASQRPQWLPSPSRQLAPHPCPPPLQHPHGFP